MGLFLGELELPELELRRSHRNNLGVISLYGNPVNWNNINFRARRRRVIN